MIITTLPLLSTLLQQLLVNLLPVLLLFWLFLVLLRLILVQLCVVPVRMKWAGGTVVCQAAVQQEQQQNSSWFQCWFHHDPNLRAEPQNQIQQTPSSSVSLSRSLCFSLLGDYWPKGQSMIQSDMFNVDPWHVYLDSSSCIQDKKQFLRRTCTSIRSGHQIKYMFLDYIYIYIWM